MKLVKILGAVLFAATSVFSSGYGHAADTVELLNVSYDPTRELYEKYNSLFITHWKEKTGGNVKINQSHGGSGKQARSVLEGLQADVVTLALAYDIDVMADKRKLLPADWQSKLAGNSSPYTSTIVFLVRKGNPKNIKDWDDLVRENIQVITPNPKTSGGARWNYLAAWAYAKEKFAGDESKIKGFIGELFKRVPVLDAGARGSTTTFVQRGIGDVLISWENEAHLAKKELGKGEFEIVYPSISVLAEPPVAVVEKNATRRKTLELANEYLAFLYSPQAQEIIAQNFYRPYDKKVLEKHAEIFPAIKTVTIADLGGWKKAQKEHFDDEGSFDQIYGME
ncbi:MAG: sulfate ABC transporter substrate-binding protein [Rickettsiales bacterium]